MSHANAALTPRAGLRLAELIVNDGWPVAVAAKMFMTSPPTARKWAARFRADSRAGSTHARRPDAPVNAAVNPGLVSAPRFYTPSSMTIPASLMSRSAPMRKPPRRSACVNAQSSGSRIVVSLSSESCPTTAPPIAPMPGETPALNLGSRTSEPAPIGPRPTGRSSGFTALSLTVGLTHGSTVPRPSGGRHYRAGCTSTIITGTTPQSEPHPSADSTTSLDITPRPCCQSSWWTSGVSSLREQTHAALLRTRPGRLRLSGVLPTVRRLPCTGAPVKPLAGGPLLCGDG